MSAVRSYPYDRLDRVSSEEARAARAWGRSAELAAWRRGGAAAEAWLGVAIVLTPGAPLAVTGPPSAALAMADAPSAVLERAHAGRIHRGALLLDGAVATALVERTLGGSGEASATTHGPMPELERGVLAYALARWLSDGDAGWKVAAVFAHPAAALEAVGEVERMSWRIEVELGGAVGGVTLIAPIRAPMAGRARRLPPWALDLPIELSVTAGAASLSVAELAAIDLRDVIVPERLSVTRGPAGLEGSVELRVVGGARSMRGRLAEGKLSIDAAGLLDDRIAATLEGTTGRRNTMTDAKMLDEMGTTPVTLAVELARFSMPLSEVAALSIGEVVSCGVSIGQSVRLRAGDQVIATGELVDVEGELGVRVLEIIARAT